MRCYPLALLLSLAVCGCANPPLSSTDATAKRPIPKSKVSSGIKVARIQERQGNLQKALRVYLDLYKTDPNNAEICHRLMVVHTRMDQPQKADQFFQQADKLHPNDPELYTDYGYACYLRGEVAQGESWLKKAHTLNPENERTTGNLALVVAAQGREEEALAYYRQYLDDAEANANLGFALIQRGDFTAARERYAKALDINPHLKTAQNALLQLAELDQAHKKQPGKTATARTAPQAKAETRPAIGTASIRG